MRIRVKVVLIVLPLLIATLLLSGFASSFSARNGITRVAMEFLGFKAQELEKYLNNQWNLLQANNLSDKKEYIEAAKNAGASFARTLIKTQTELILALNAQGRVEMATIPITLNTKESVILLNLVKAQATGWQEFKLAGEDRVGQTFFFEPFQWFCLVSEEKSAFYVEVQEITTQSAVILASACVIALILLLVFSGYLTRPITSMVTAMKEIITYNDLSARVAVEYKDEIGDLAHTFNLMIEELGKAYNQIKNFAFQAVLAKKHEQEIRNIFQKYVPKDVINRCFKNPEAMLVGEDRVLAVLFADIRRFTTISEGMKPDKLVKSLNRYFSLMVDIIMKREGIVDKYIGDAIMAFFGAPVKHENDVLQAVYSGLEMNEALADFNREQVKKGEPCFRIGVGINYGQVTVGNIGSERKMDYTVIGDMVNLASRLEILTKTYKQELIFSESVYDKVKNVLPCRLLDRVVVKGKTHGERIYTTKKNLSERERTGWSYHHTALKLYYQRDFQKSLIVFSEVQKYLPDDYVSALYSDRCRAYINNPPPLQWQGIHVMAEK